MLNIVVLVSGGGTNLQAIMDKIADGTVRLIDDIVNNLTNVGECTITGGDHKNLKIKNVGATAALALKDAGVCETKITNGILYNMDMLTIQKMPFRQNYGSVRFYR